MEDFPEIIRNLNLSYDNFDGLLELRKMHEIIIEVMREKNDDVIFLLYCFLCLYYLGKKQF